MKAQSRLGWVRAVALVMTLGILSPPAWSLDLDQRIHRVERDNQQILGTLGHRDFGQRTLNHRGPSGHTGGLTLKLKKKKKKKVVRKNKRARKVRA